MNKQGAAGSSFTRWARLAALLAASGGPCVAIAAALDVKVIDRAGQPAADVVVLVESAAGARPRVPAEPVVILQQNLRFVPALTVVPLGATLRFVNRDDYDHHVRSVPVGPLGSMAPAASFEFRLGPAGSKRVAESNPVSADWTSMATGPIGLGCHLHSSMRGHVYVAATPWFTKTDSQGRARLDDVPEGAVTLRLWHPQQLLDQAPQDVVVSPAGSSIGATLNFAPPRR